MCNKLCPHCQQSLASEREQYINCCYVCRRYGLLLGVWPEKRGAMLSELTDEQIARLFSLCAEIVAVQKSMPAPPRGMDGALELARNLRGSLSQHRTALAELGLMLASIRME